MPVNRTEFHSLVGQALALAESRAAEIWAVSPPPRLRIIDRAKVRRAVQHWPEVHIDWSRAVRRCRSYSQSCFVGIEVENRICLLALIRVSRRGLHTSLLVVEKDRDLVPAGVAMSVMDVTLEAIAAIWDSKRIVIDDPLPELIPYYRTFGFRSMKLRGRSASAMFKLT